jgi:predicted RND superfamily exporter protein
VDNTTLLFGLAAVPVIVALVQVFKAFVTDERFWPLIAIVVGVAWNVAVGYITRQDLAVAGVTGIVVGLAASGLYDVGRGVGKTVVPASDSGTIH